MKLHPLNLAVLGALIAWGLWAYTGRNQAMIGGGSSTLSIPRGSFSAVNHLINGLPVTQVTVRGLVGRLRVSDPKALIVSDDGQSFSLGFGTYGAFTLTDDQGSWQIEVS